MKHFFTTILLAVVFTAPVLAQDMSIGAKGGLNFATVSGDKPENWEDNRKLKTGIHLGGYLAVRLTDEITFQPEMLLSFQGFKYKGSSKTVILNTTTETDNDLKLNATYLNFPLLAKYHLSEALSIGMGPSLGFLLSAKMKNDNSVKTTVKVPGQPDIVSEIKTSGSVDVKDDNSGFDFGLVFDIDYQLQSGLHTYFRYNLGLSNTSDIGGSSYKTTNSVIQLGIAYPLVEL